MSTSARGPAALSPVTGSAEVAPSAAKADLRRSILAARRSRGDAEVAAAAEPLAEGVLALAGTVAGVAGTVAAYVSMPREPPTGTLLRALRRGGAGVLVPVLLPDRDLDWEQWNQGGPAAAGPSGVGAVSGARLVVVPALAVGRDGTRLGRGGGSYDRALARADPAALVVALLWDGELLDKVPAQEHDLPVDAVVTPSGTYVLRAPARRPEPAADA